MIDRKPYPADLDVAQMLDDDFITGVDREKRVVYAVSADDYRAERYDWRHHKAPVPFDDLKGKAPFWKRR